MNRLQKKCTIGSAGVHLTLAAVLLIGPAFRSRKASVDDMPVLDFIPLITTDDARSGGGNPAAKPPPMAQQAPQPPVPQPAAQPPPRPAPQEQREPEPPKIQSKQPDAEALPTPRKRPLPNVSTTPVKPRKNTEMAKKQPAVDRSEQQAQSERAERARQLASLLKNTARGLKENISTATTIESYGTGGGGEAYANYDQLVKSRYQQAWIAPDDSASDEAVTKVSVTIARDGTVTASRIITPSGDPLVDRSVRRTLDKVTFVAPFPEGAKDRERIFIINFNLKAKRLLG